MATKKEIMDSIITWDVITNDENGNPIECVEVTFPDRIIDVNMDTREVNIGLIVKKILEDDLYK
ncbi:hypothetical protein [Clostridium massiliamazoniense]|uniref:hypothetical protein n=1 Tax=Clostridium massiliamazoniense TaxID=1347366 RepID=UPI0006D797C0|nr:hypothetical protein [Clostridium massiliamazoniense]